jgi:hypothetical protein
LADEDPRTLAALTHGQPESISHQPPAPRRAVCYAISVRDSDPGRRTQLQKQLLASVGSLRTFNRTVEVVVFWRGPLDAHFITRLTGLGAVLEEIRAVESASPTDDLLVRYGVMFKYAALRAAAVHGYTQILLVDCDTLWLSDVETLFGTYSDADWYACAEAGSRRGTIRYDATYLDEDALSDLARRVGARAVPPINSGVMLLSGRALEFASTLATRVEGYAVRLMAGLATSGLDLRRNEVIDMRDRIKSGDVVIDPLPFPTSNQWLIEEVALWLALGTLDGLTLGDLAPHHVALGGDVFARPREASNWILGHYFSTNTRAAQSWWQTAEPVPAGWRIRRPAKLDIDESLVSSPLVADRAGFAVYEELFTTKALNALSSEALQQYWSGWEQHLLPGKGGDGRGGHPARKLVTAGGGPIQDELYQAPEMLDFLQKICALPVAPTGRRGTFNYYLRHGDFIDLHLDVLHCELVVLTALHDRSEASHPGGAYVVYPQYLGAPLSQVRRDRHKGELVKLRPGQSLVMFGGLVPHRVVPVHAAQKRVVSALCFKAGAGVETVTTSR